MSTAGESSRTRELGASPRGRAELFARLLGRQLERTLQVVDLEVEGEVVEAEAFGMGEGPRTRVGRRRQVRYEAPLSYARNEPRVEVIRNGLERALGSGSFVGRDGPLAVDGFRLRNLRQWASYPTGSLTDNIGSISSYCNADCEFCYEKGTRGSRIALGRAQLSLQEVDTRIKYYSGDTKTGLIPSSRLSLESFASPHCLEILERVQAAAPGEWLEVTTNGSYLTEEVVERLARLRPVMVSVSLNAAAVDVSMRTMGYRTRQEAETALASPALLRQYEIPFVGSYVPWPSKPLSDMADTVRLLDQCDAVAARICLPSWTRYSATEPPFETEEYWAEVLAAAARLREEVEIPVRPTPNMYEMRTIRPAVQGTTKHSPAAGAGFRYGDVIVAIDGEAVYTRPEVTRWLAKRFEDGGIQRTVFTVERGRERLEIGVERPSDPESLRYPFRWLLQPGAQVVWGAALGLHLADGPELTSFVRLKEMVEEYPGKRVLLLVSKLMADCFWEGMGMLGELAAFVESAEMYLQELMPAYWGGNIMVGDLWTVEDVTEGTKRWIERQGVRPDVVIVPSSFLSQGGRDLVGRCYLEIERELDTELRLLPCYRIVI